MRFRNFLVALTLAWAIAPASAADITKGRVAWMKFNCNGCHGGNAKGGMGPNIVGKDAHDLSTAISGDKTSGGMINYTKNTNPASIPTSTDLDNMSAYLKSIDTASEPKWVDWWNH
ncbi:MAG: c-type cytochrome [Methylocystis sp.]|uniref:c-type cytochrome n=1 Tax=Methylocystis sp. TaxID=1911079 RepID=UPI003DA64A22